MLQHPNQTTDVCQPVKSSGRLEPYSQSESSCLLLKPLLLHTWAFRRGGVGSRQAAVVPHKSGGYCRYWSIESCSKTHFGRCSGSVVLAICFVSVFFFRHALFPFTQAGSFSPPPKPSLLHAWPLGEGVLIVIVTASTSPSLGGVVYDVRDCFVDRHNKKTAPSKGQARRLNKSPCNSANNISAGAQQQYNKQKNGKYMCAKHVRGNENFACGSFEFIDVGSLFGEPST